MAKAIERFRYTEEGDSDLLKRYAELVQQAKDATEEAKALRDQVWDILFREDLDCVLEGDGFAYEVSYRRQWSPKVKTVEREIDVAGQFIVASVAQLDDAKKRLENLCKTPDMEEGQSPAITAKLI